MLPPFTDSPFHLAVFVIAWALWWTPEVIRSFTRHAKGDAVVRDKGSMAVIFASIYVGAFAGFYVAFAVRGAAVVWNRPAVFYAGIACLVLGVVLRQYAIHVLGQYFTLEVAVRANQSVVQAGPYHWVRHPSYSGSLLSLLGVGLALANWLSVIIILVSALIGYSYRVRVEERALVELIGQPYVEYMNRTRCFIPFLF